MLTSNSITFGVLVGFSDHWVHKTHGELNHTFFFWFIRDISTMLQLVWNQHQHWGVILGSTFAGYLLLVSQNP